MAAEDAGRLAQLWTFLGIRPGERSRVVLFALWSMAVVGGVVIVGGLAGRALFLSALPREYVALKFLLPPVALAVVVAVYARLLDRLRRDRLVVGTSLLLGVVVLGLRVGLSADFGDGLVFLCLLFVALEVIGAVAIIQFWTMAGDLFDAREAKRLFGLVAAGGTVAAVVFSAGLGAAARAVPPADLLYGLVGALLVCAACAALLGRRHRDELEAQKSGARAGRGDDGEPEGLGALLRPRLVRSIAGLIVTAAVASAIADYQLDLALQNHYGSDAAGMVTFLGVLRAAAGTVALLLQVFVARHLLSRLGLRGGLLALPLLMLLGQVGIVLTGGLLIAVALPKAADGALKFDLNNTSVNLLFLPVAPAVRARLKAVIDGILKPVVLSGVGGVFLLVGRLPQVTVMHWAVVAIGVVVAWFGFVRSAVLAYVDELQAGLRQRRLGGEALPLSLGDETSSRVLSDALEAGDAGLVMHALAVLREEGGASHRPGLVALLDHPVEEVRLDVVGLLGRGEDPELVEPLRRRLQDDDSVRVRAGALVALAASGGPEVAAEVLRYLDDGRPALRAAAVRAALLHLGIDGILHAASALKELLDDPDPAIRAQGARTLGALGARSFYSPLVPLLDDPEVEVRRAAVKAAGRLRARALALPLLPRLGEPRLSREAQHALAACLESDPRWIVERLQDDDLPMPVTVGLVQTLGLLGPAGRQPLTDLLLDHRPRVRGAAARALRASRAELDPERVPEALRLEEQGICELATCLAALDDDADHTTGTLEDRLDESLDRLLDLIALRSPGFQADQVRESLRSTDKRRCANAIELLDHVVEPTHRPVLLALAEGHRRPLLAEAEARSVPPPVSATAALTGLAGTADPWLRSCALFDLSRGSDPAEAVLRALDHPDPLVLETARRAAEQLGLPEARSWEKTMAMTTLEKVLFLKSIPLFANIPGETLAQVAPIAHEVRHAEGDTFIKAGESGDCLYVVVDGEVEVWSAEETIAEVGNRAIIGELAVLTDRPRNADCIAGSNLLMLRIGKEDFWELLEEHPELSTRILRQVIDRYVDSAPAPAPTRRRR